MLIDGTQRKNSGPDSEMGFLTKGRFIAFPRSLYTGNLQSGTRLGR